MTEQHVTVRFYAAAADAAGTKETTLAIHTNPMQLDDFLEGLPRALPEAGNGTALNLSGVCAYSSFLINAVQANPSESVLAPGDTLDILPPFAGG